MSIERVTALIDDILNFVLAVSLHTVGLLSRGNASPRTCLHKRSWLCLDQEAIIMSLLNGRKADCLRDWCLFCECDFQ